jgi:two-component system response regulator FixJ
MRPMTHDSVFIVDDDTDIRDSLRSLLDAAGFKACGFASAEELLGDASAKRGCLIADVRMPGMSGLELLEEIRQRQWHLPVIIMTGHADIPLAVRVMKAGAVDFLEKPFASTRLMDSVQRALELGPGPRPQNEETRAARKLLTHLSSRERTVLEKLVQGQANKTVAHELGISPRTVEIHRAHIMLKMDASSLADLVRAVLTAQSA